MSLVEQARTCLQWTTHETNSRVPAMKAFEKDVLTTGEVAKLCNVASRTVSKWFDSGQIKGHCISVQRTDACPSPTSSPS